MSTDDVVERAKAALEGITPGPWKIDQYDPGRTDSIVSVADDRIGGWVEVAKSIGADAQFIAAAPGLVRNLVDEVLRLRGLLDHAGRAIGAPYCLDDPWRTDAGIES